MVAGSCNYIFKPYRLELENYGKRDYRWSYFRLQLEPIEPISNAIYEDCRESLIEDFPGHYIESNLASYGRYDDGTEVSLRTQTSRQILNKLVCYLFKTICI